MSDLHRINYPRLRSLTFENAAPPANDIWDNKYSLTLTDVYPLWSTGSFLSVISRSPGLGVLNVPGTVLDMDHLFTSCIDASCLTEPRMVCSPEVITFFIDRVHLSNLKRLEINPPNLLSNATFCRMLVLPGPRTIASFIRVKTFEICHAGAQTDREGSDDSDMLLGGLCSITGRFSDSNYPFSLTLTLHMMHARYFYPISSCHTGRHLKPNSEIPLEPRP